MSNSAHHFSRKETKMETYDDRNFKEKVNSWLEDRKRDLDQFRIWACANPDKAVTLGVAAITAGAAATRSIAAAKNRKEAKRLKDRMVYERRGGLGLYYETKRKMNNKEKDELSRRVREGEMVGDVLQDMKLI